MSPLLNVVGAIQLCAGCTVEFEPHDTLGAAEDPAGVGILPEVLDMGDRGYLVSSEVLGGVVIVYDSDGRYQRELTREGDGPGELRGEPTFAMGPDGIVLFEPADPMLHFYTSDLGFRRTLQVSGRVFTVLWDAVTEGWLVNYDGVGWGPDGTFQRLESGVLILDHGGDTIRSMRPDERSVVLRRGAKDVIRGPDNRLWAASLSGRVEVFDQDLGLVDSLQLELPGVDEWDREAHPGAWPAQVNDIRLAPDGTGVWVFAIGPGVDMSELMEALNETREQGDRPAIEELADTFIYSLRLDPGGLTLVGRAQLGTLVRPLGNGEGAFDVVETPDGNRRVRVGRIRIARGGG